MRVTKNDGTTMEVKCVMNEDCIVRVSDDHVLIHPSEKLEIIEKYLHDCILENVHYMLYAYSDKVTDQLVVKYIKTVDLLSNPLLSLSLYHFNVKTNGKVCLSYRDGKRSRRALAECKTFIRYDMTVFRTAVEIVSNATEYNNNGYIAEYLLFNGKISNKKENSKKTLIDGQILGRNCQLKCSVDRHWTNPIFTFNL